MGEENRMGGEGAEGPSAALSILHLEDDALDRELIANLLRQAGLEAGITAVDGQGGFLAALEKRDLDIIISDYNLPGFNGLSALAVARERRPDLPFLFVSGTLGEEAAVACLRNGATDYVLKHNLARLVPAVRRALAEAGERRSRLAAEDALRASEEQYRDLFENASEWLFSLGPDGTFQFANPAFTRALELEGGELHAIRFRDLLPEDQRPAWDGLLDRLRAGAPSLRAELRVLNASGRQLVAEGNLGGKPGPAGVAVRGILRDITERLDLEQRYRQAQKLEAVGRLAGGIAHDFNNLLTVIRSYSELMLLDGHLPADTADQARAIYAASERAARLTSQLLAFSRKQVMRPEPLDLNRSAQDIVKMLARIIGEDIRVRFSPTPGLPMVLADAGMVEQVIMNLAVNARDAMPGGGELRLATGTALRAGPPPVAGESLAGGMPALPPKDPSEHVTLIVADTGTGIPPEALPHIFEPFFTTKEVGKGTGLGLSTVYGIVRQHGGWVEVDSQVGRGTEFRVFFPAAPAGTHTAPPQPEAASQAGRGETLLVAEDEPELRKLFRAALEQAGYRVLEAESGAAALKVWERERGKVHALLTDIMMPDGVTGRELAQRLTAEDPGLKVLFISGYSPDMGGAANDLGHRFLSKPFGMGKLARAVRACLDGAPEPA